MARIQLHEFGKSDTTAAAELLAQRQRRLRKVDARLPDRFEEPLPWYDAIEQLEPERGVVATVDGRVAGFMLGRKDLPDPRSMGARYGDPRAGFVPVVGHAVAPDADVRAVYTAMYAELGAHWVRRGFFSHGMHVIAADTEAHEALVNLGFGRKMVAAVRPIAEPPAGGASVQVRQATRADEDDVHRLEDELDFYHSHPPMFMPLDAETTPGARRLQESLFENPEAVIFLAFEGDRAVGMTSLMMQHFIPDCVTPERMVYLYQGVVSEGARSNGAGEALLRTALGWAKERGYEHCGLHYHAANPTGGFFWRKHGFEAVQYAMQRHVDDRVAWARDWA